MRAMSKQRGSSALGFGCLLLAAYAGCGSPAAPVSVPTFGDPPIHCNADLAQGPTHKLVTKQLFLPHPWAGRQYPEDYDGNGKTENQFRYFFTVAGVLRISPDA